MDSVQQVTSLCYKMTYEKSVFDFWGNRGGAIFWTENHGTWMMVTEQEWKALGYPDVIYQSRSVYRQCM